MTLQEYINYFYGGKPYWFLEEITNHWHVKRISDVLSVKQYLDGKHKILDRPDEVFNGRTIETKKIILSYAKTIINFQTSFLLKNPVTLTCPDSKTLDVFKNIYEKGNYDLVDYKILQNMIKYGETYEYIYLDKNGIIKSKIIDSADGYPIYDDEMNYLGFIEYYNINGISYYIIFTDDTVTSYSDIGGELHKTGQYKNLSGLPIVYRIPSETDPLTGRSDLLDYLDILDSMEDLISKYFDAFYKYITGIPVVKGMKLAIDKQGNGAIDKNVVGYALQLDEGADFEFVQNKTDIQSFKVLFNTLKQSLLDISCTPAVAINSTDISNLSEVAIKMLYSMAEIKGSMNANYLKEGFCQRWAQMQKILKTQNINVDISGLDCTFKMNIPQNSKDIVDDLKKLKEIGGISLPTLLANNPYVFDVATELKNLENTQNVVDDENK